MAEIPVEELIRKAAVDRGVDPAVALRIAERESSLNPTAKNRRSSAYGLFQITDDTWKQYGGTKENRTSVPDNIRIGMDILADNERTYVRKFGRAPSAAELYSMHFLGRTGGPRVLGADPSAPVASVVSPKVIKANPELRNQTVGEFIASMQKKMGAVGDTALARRSVKEQGPGTVPMPQAPKETMRGHERLQPLAQDMVNQLGPNYQAALAAMALADTRDDDEEDENSLSRQYREQIAAQETEDIFSTPQRIAGLELGFQSPFPEEQQPLMMKDGGEARLSTTFGESAVPDTAAEEYARFLEASKKSKVPAPLPAMLKEKIFDPLTKEGLREDGMYYDTMTPQPVTSKSPTTLFAGVPGAKVVELGGLQDTTLSGFVFARPSSKGKKVEDVVFVAPPYSKRASDILFRRAPERWVENPNQELERQVLLGHETEHLLKRRGNRDINETFDQLAKQAREEDFIGSFFKKPASALRSKFVKDAAGSASYLKDKFGVTLPSYFDPKSVGNYTFHEQVATLAGIEQAFGVDLTQDPVLRKTLFEDPDVRRAYSAVTGLRQTRLDPRDLPPYTLQPDIPYNPKAAEIRTKPVKKAKGGEMFADPMGVADSGPITEDTRKALTTRQGLSAAEMMRLFQNVGREGVSNLESLARGSVSAIPGVVGDIESIFRDDKNRRFATSKEVERQYLPQRLTKPTKESEGFVELGSYVDPTVAKPVAKAAAKAGKALGPTAADMLQGMAPAAQPMYIVKPTGGNWYPDVTFVPESPVSADPSKFDKVKLKPAYTDDVQKFANKLVSNHTESMDHVTGQIVFYNERLKANEDLLRQAKEGLATTSSPVYLERFQTIFNDLTQAKNQLNATLLPLQDELAVLQANNAPIENFINKKVAPYIRNKLGTDADTIRKAMDDWAEKKPALIKEKQDKIQKLREKIDAAAGQRGINPEQLINAQGELNKLTGELEQLQARTGSFFQDPRAEIDFAREGAVTIGAGTKRSLAGMPAKGVAKSPAGRSYESRSDQAIDIDSATDALSTWKSIRGVGEPGEELLPPPAWLEEAAKKEALGGERTPIYSFEYMGAGMRNTFQAQFDHFMDEIKTALDPTSPLPDSLKITPKQLEKMSFEDASTLVDKINGWRSSRTAKVDLKRANTPAVFETRAYDVIPNTNQPNEKGFRWVEIKKPEGLPDQEATKVLKDALAYEGEIMKHCVGSYCSRVEKNTRVFSLRDVYGRPYTTIEVSPSVVSDVKTGKDKEVGFGINQIKGILNGKPSEEAMPFINDFVQNNQWDYIKDARHTSLSDDEVKKLQNKMKGGVHRAKGGMVEKSDYDNRKYI